MTEESEEKVTKENELHPVVTLLLKRAASHPEEISEGRWGWVESEIMQSGSEKEKAIVEPIMNKLRMDTLYKAFMKELLAPEQPDLFAKSTLNNDINPLRTSARQGVKLSDYQSELAHRQAQAMKLK